MKFSRLRCLAVFSFILAGGIIDRDFVRAESYADEDKDWGVSSTSEFRTEQYHAPTPREVPGAKTILTTELQAMMFSGTERPILIDVLTTSHISLPDAIWWSRGGLAYSNGTAERLVQTRFEVKLKVLTENNKAKPVVFFCVSSQCWLSYNAALRAVKLGYTRVYWYRGGIDAWNESLRTVDRW